MRGPQQVEQATPEKRDPPLLAESLHPKTILRAASAPILPGPV
jgi:hypothetical protein